MNDGQGRVFDRLARSWHRTRLISPRSISDRTSAFGIAATVRHITEVSSSTIGRWKVSYPSYGRKFY